VLHLLAERRTRRGRGTERIVPRYPSRSVEVGSILVDFDGTACPYDVSEELLDEFGQGGWRAYDEAVDRGEVGLRQAAEQQAAMLRASREEMLAFALERFAVEPTFPSFVGWAESRGMPLAVISDGFGFYVRPLLEKAGLGRVEVFTNEFEDGRLLHPHAHPACVGCGTCKMLAANTFRERHGSVAFIGEGQSDRYGALYSDIVFAKEDLVRICEQDGVPFLPWTDFDDVREMLEGPQPVPGAVAPERCPGWRLP
jgi:2-hydroxy-3-keto-5-methylthiopentenyl-1-phosphate phosphatase